MSTTSGSAHLTDEQFAECVTVAPSAESQFHLDECEHCRRELAAFDASLSAFGTTAMAWSEATPKVDLRAAAKLRARRTMERPLGWALATAALLLIAVPVWKNHHAPSAGSEAAVMATPDDSADQIAQDNRLLQSVYAELTPQDASPFKEYGMTDRTTSRTKGRMESRLQ